MAQPSGCVRRCWSSSHPKVLPSSGSNCFPPRGCASAAALAPPLRGGERATAVLRAEGKGPPHVIRPPSRLQRTAGGLRAGLRTATEDLGPDARALLPGLVVGDTTRVTPELHEAFRATDLTHLMAVSGANLAILLVLLIGPPGSALRVERRGLAPAWGISLRGTALLGGGLTLAFVLVCGRNRACCGPRPAV